MSSLEHHKHGAKNKFKQNGLIVSCQPVPNGAMDDVSHVVGFARAALSAGAVGLRIQSTSHVRAVRGVTDAPIIGLIKRDLPDSAVRITPFVEDIKALVAAGADIIAFDATHRDRPVPVANLLAAVREAGALSMADCSFIEDAHYALAQGADFVGSTLAGYTGGPEPEEPDLALIRAMRHLTPHVIAEGCIRTPQQAQEAARAGAAFVVVGSAITRPEHITSWFCNALDTVYHAPTATKALLAVDLGGSKTTAALIQGTQILDRVDFVTDRSATPQQWLKAIIEATAPWCGRYQRAGFAVTGVVRDGLWQAMNRATLNIEKPFALQDQAKASLGVPVFVANDAQAAAWGEYKASEGKENLTFITLSTGLGGGIIVNGKLMLGIAGHFGQILNGENSQPVENSLSGTFIAARAKSLGYEMTAKDVFDAAQGGESWAQEIVDDVACRFARFCCNIQLMLDPARIVVGGGVGLAPGFLDKVRAEINMIAPSPMPQLYQAILGRDAGIWGIADLAMNFDHKKLFTICCARGLLGKNW